MLPPDLTPLVDGDILRYEIGFGAETGWRALRNDPEGIPPFYFVEEMLLQRIEKLKDACKTTVQPEIFITEGRTFRDDVAVTKPYKGTRKESKPWHFRNLTVYLTDVLGATVCEGLEADDVMAIRHGEDPNTIVCSRDKDLKQVPGYFYSWELGRQPSFGPTMITKEGTLHLDRDKKPPKLSGTGDLFFYAQLLSGDTVDNIPGLPGCGAVATFNLLTSVDTPLSSKERVYQAYERTIGEGWKEYLLEQGRLVWIIRRNKDGVPQMWEHGLED